MEDKQNIIDVLITGARNTDGTVNEKQIRNHFKTQEEYIWACDRLDEAGIEIEDDDYAPRGSTDPMKLYMHDIARFPKLTIEEEHALGDRILAGDMSARDELVNCNLKLVVHIAKRYQHMSSLNILDLIQEGNIGLTEAATRFDYHKGFKFSTYAAFWIKREIARALTDQSRTIRLPANIVELVSKINKTKKRLLAENGKEPTPEEIAKELGLTEERVLQLMDASKAPVSLDKPVNDEEDTFIGDMISDERVNDAGSEIHKEDTLKQILQVLDTLEPKERDVLYYRFGLDGGVNRSLKDAGKFVGVTRERVRQIEIKALRKLQQPARANAIKKAMRG